LVEHIKVKYLCSTAELVYKKNVLRLKEELND